MNRIVVTVEIRTVVPRTMWEIPEPLECKLRLSQGVKIFCPTGSG
jgi:hypothetical protein